MTKRKSPRLYVPLDARFFDDDRIVRLGEKAAFLYLNILCQVKLDHADGTISRAKIARLGIQGWQQRLEKLEEAQLVLEVESGDYAQITYLVPSWSRWNLLTHEIEERRAIAKENAMKRWHPDQRTDANRNAIGMQNPMLSKEKRRKENPEPLGSLVDNLIQGMTKESYRDE